MNLAFGASDFAAKSDFVFWYTSAISAVLMLGVTVAIVWFCYRYHRSRSPKAEHVPDSLALEMTWTIIPTILVMTMFWFGWIYFRDFRRKDPNARIVNVTASQWQWRFMYVDAKGQRKFEIAPEEEEKKGEVAELVLAIDEPVQLNLASTDVLHAFYVPAFRVKEDAVPGRENYVSFTPKELGVFPILCAEYCGGGGSEARSLEFEVSQLPVTVIPSQVRPVRAERDGDSLFLIAYQDGKPGPRIPLNPDGVTRSATDKFLVGDTTFQVERVMRVEVRKPGDKEAKVFHVGTTPVKVADVKVKEKDGRETERWITLHYAQKKLSLRDQKGAEVDVPGSMAHELADVGSVSIAVVPGTWFAATSAREPGHWSMIAYCRVVSKADFQTYFESDGKVRPWRQKKPGGPAAGAGEPDGLRTLVRANCITCHSTDGAPNPNGPTFKGLFGSKRSVVRDGEVHTVEADEKYLLRSITDPHYEIVEGWSRTMTPRTDLSEAELKAILDYLKGLK